ncbi:TolC family outer membrane protein [Endozoicomonas sp. 8E]|uniref:TolC family outer membrane protein n=1 Tax=Endozoicomonas sp. 8E TaxID=3035692 RepID=UPI002938FB6A|nr:TolC family outer membrane protein [Endozoicomonas sp. 8E]WOG26704.1 TolC family outer membrane protein [Endozoicomonas sp. 8E]
MPKTYLKGFLLAALASSIMSAQAAETEYNLLEVYNLALKNDAQLAAARADMMATQEGSTQARALLLPNLSLSGGTQYNKTSLEAAVSDVKDDYNSHTWGATLSQPLFNMASWFGYDSAKFQSAQAEVTFSYEQQNLILRVAEAYFNVLRAEDSLITAIAEEKAVKQQLDQARERYNVGLIAETDVLEARARYDGARVVRIDGENSLSVSYEALRTIINKDVRDIGKLNKTMPVTAPTPAVSDEWVNNALKNNLQLEAARESLKAAESNIKAKKSGHAPTVDAFASYNYNSSDADSARVNIDSNGIRTGDGDQTVVGVKFNLPLFAGGATSSQVRQATYQMESVQQNYDKALREINSGTRNLFRTVNSDVARVEARCQGIVSSESALKATESGYEVGTRNITDVLDAQKTLFAAQRDYLNARYDFIVNTLKLKLTAGTLNPEDLTQLNNWIVSSEEMSIPAQCRAN